MIFAPVVAAKNSSSVVSGQSKLLYPSSVWLLSFRERQFLRLYKLHCSSTKLDNCRWRKRCTAKYSSLHQDTPMHCICLAH